MTVKEKEEMAHTEQERVAEAAATIDALSPQDQLEELQNRLKQAQELVAEKDMEITRLKRNGSRDDKKSIPKSDPSDILLLHYENDIPVYASPEYVASLKGEPVSSNVDLEKDKEITRFDKSNIASSPFDRDVLLYTSDDGVQHYASPEVAESLKGTQVPPKVSWTWTPTYKSAAQKNKALKYFQKCECGKNGQVFQDFQIQLLTYIVNRKRGQRFSQTFLEYVILEVTARERSMRLSNRIQACFFRGWAYSILRSECLFRWGRSPRLYTKVYYELIIDSLEKAKESDPLAFDPCFDIPSLRGRLYYR